MQFKTDKKPQFYHQKKPGRLSFYIVWIAQEVLLAESLALRL